MEGLSLTLPRREISPREDALLVLSPDPVFPLDFGGAVRTGHMARLASSAFRKVDVIGFAKRRADGPTSIANVHFSHVTRPDRGIGRRAWEIRATLGPRLGYGFARRVCAAKSAKVVQLESPYLHPAIRRRRPRTVILNAHNIFSRVTKFEQPGLLPRINVAITGRRKRAAERSAWADADHVFFCSDSDYRAARAIVPELQGKSTIVPNCVDLAEFDVRREEAFERGGSVLFVGTLTYPPNHYAAARICTDIAPHLPGLDFTIVGRGAPPAVPIPSNVTFTGPVASVQPYLRQAQVAIAPISQGSGTRLKILEYLAAGLPVVSTAIGAEGIDLEWETHARRAETDAEFVSAIADLHSDAARCVRLGRAGRRLIEQRYQWQSYRAAVTGVYQSHAM